MARAFLEMESIIKEFSNVRVLDVSSFKVQEGEIHALCGENGAGKSTLVKILSGVYPHGEYEGEIFFDGQVRKFGNIKASEQVGIEIIYQELELVEELSVAENIFLGNEPLKYKLIDYNTLFSRAEEVLNKFGMDIKVDSLVKNLGVGQKQMVSICKALSKSAKLLILDEPTAALTIQEIEHLFVILRGLKEQGVTCIFISHKLQELKELCDTITILRDGYAVITENAENLSEDDIIKHMVGREITDRFPKAETTPSEVMLKVDNYSVTGIDGKKIIDDVSFEVRAGEVLGVAGLIGSGRTELVSSIFGAEIGKVSGDVYFNGEKVNIRAQKDAISLGIGMVTEERKITGLVMIFDIIKNITLASLKKVCKRGVLSEDLEFLAATEYSNKLHVRAPGLHAVIESLSGGNQQKVSVAKTLMTEPKLIIMDEPTRGIDVGAKYEIYLIINDLVQSGAAVIMVSSELPEILGMSDRIIVMNSGRKVAEFAGNEADQESIMRYAAQ